MPEQGSEYIYDVFISYSHADEVWVRTWLGPLPSDAGLRVCIDQDDFEIGVPSIINMERAVEKSRITLLVLTPNWVTSEYANFEALLRTTDDPLNYSRRVLPLMLKKCEPPKRLSILTYADFTHSDEWESKFKRLVKAINDKSDRAPEIEIAGLSSPFFLPQVDVRNFIGRNDELRQLDDLLLKPDGEKICGIVGLAGTGGIGKSALACHFAESRRNDFPDGVIGLRVDGKDPNTIVREFARCIKEEIDPEDTRDAATLMQEMFRYRRALLIFDNAEDATISELFPGGSRCAVIVTTRDQGLPIQLGIPAEGRIDLSPLPRSQSFKLLRRLLGDGRIGAEWRVAIEIIELVGSLPLALQIVGATLRTRAGLSLADYSALLREERLEMLKVRRDPHLNVRASFSLSLKFLEVDEIDFFSCLSVCAQDGFSLQSAMAAGNCNKLIASERLDYLCQLSLLNRSQLGANRYVFHPLLRSFAAELADERSLRVEAEERHARFYIGFVRSSNLDDISVTSIIAEEIDDIILAAEWIQRQEVADDEIAYRLQPLFQRTGHWEKAIKLISGFLSVAEHTNDWRAIAQLRIQQAKYLSLRGDMSNAEKALSPLADIINKIEKQDERQRCETMWLTTLGGILQRQGHFNKAVEAFQKSAAIEENASNQHGQAKVLKSLGGVLQRLGRFDEALDVFQRSYGLLMKLEDKRGQAMVLNSLGGVLQRLGRFNEAVNAFRASSTIEESLNNQRGQAIVLNSLGGALQRQGKFDDAVVAFRRSYVISEDLDDKRSLAMVLNSLGGVLQRQGKFDDAMRAFQQSIEIGESLRDKRHLAMAHTAMGTTLLAHGDAQRAITELCKGFEIDEELENRRGIGIVAPSLVETLVKLNRPDEALAYCQRALAIAPDDRRLLRLRDQLSSTKNTTVNSSIMRGTIKRIIQSQHGQRFGFIIPDDKSADIYFNEKDVEPDCFSKLAAGVRVEAEIKREMKGPRAKNIRLIS